MTVEVIIMEFRVDDCIPDVETIMALAEDIADFDLNAKKPEDVHVGRIIMPKVARRNLNIKMHP
ncbi:hypothetical protein E0703_07700 [Lactobacillus helveticus]|nr:hypothetical protein [Lactobacillus helveticus]